MGRSILAVIAGYLVMTVAIVVLFLGWFRAPDQIPSTAFMTIAIAYGFAAAVLGGYVCGAIAGRAELEHGMVLAGVGLVLTLVSAAMGDGGEPLWFRIGNASAMVGGVLAGASLRRIRARRA